MSTASRRIACGLAVCTTVLSCGCSSTLAEIHKFSAIRHRVRLIAGPNAIDCGDNLFPNLVPKNNACAVGAMTEHSPFYIVWNIPSDSSTVIRGIAMNNTGQMFMASETHEPSGSRFNTSQCPAAKLVPDPTVTTAKVLTCNP